MQCEELLEEQESITEKVVKASKDERRERILNGKITPTIFALALPLAAHSYINYLYGIFDLIIISRFGIGSVDGVAILDQIRIMILTVGVAIALGGAILISRKVGAGEMDAAKRISNNLFILALIIVSIMLLIFIPFATPFLELLNTPQRVIDEYLRFFNVQIISAAVVVLNGVFIGIEKARGNTKRLLYINLAAMFVKITLTLLFVFLIEDATPVHIALATLIAQSVTLTFALIILLNPKNPLGLSIKTFKIDSRILKTILKISLPIFVGRFMFSFGKVFVNSQAALAYDTMVVGALALSNSLAGLVSQALLAFEDIGATMTSQNYGNKNINRTFQIFKKLLVISLMIGIVGVLLLTLARPFIVNFLVPIDNTLPQCYIDQLNKQRYMIRRINLFESIGLPFWALQVAPFALLLGYGKTSLTMLTATARLFVFRIPTLLIMIHAGVSWYSTGIAMGVSNALAGILAFGLAMWLIKSIKKNGGYKEITYLRD